MEAKYQTVLVSNRLRGEQRKINDIIFSLAWARLGF
jgi:hypothetical protein